MKFFRKLTTALTLAAITSLAMINTGCDYINKVIAKDKLNQGAILYNQGQNKRAQELFKGATETDPTNAIAWLYYGATLVKDYKKDNISDSEKEGIATQAIDVYKKALDLSANNCVSIDNAISYLATIYDDLKKTEDWRVWMEKRAESECSPKEAKAQSYYSIAVRYWQCSYDETTRYQDKTAKDSFHYRNMDYPAALPDKQKADDCTTKGLEYIEKALNVDPEYVDAWYYKGLLYREKQKLTKEEAKRRELDKLAVKIADDATALQKKKEAAAAQQQQAEAVPKG
jgi:tetratricopeptide (TPR) repeat protein